MGSWASEHLVNFFLDLFAALGAAWLFFRYQPIISDYRARRSVEALERRIRFLESNLNENIAIFRGDVKLFIAEIVHISLRCIVGTVFLAIALLSILMFIIYSELDCQMRNSCERYFFTWKNILELEIWKNNSNQVMMVIMSFVVIFMLTRAFIDLSKLTNPNAYRARLEKRIATLRTRLPEQLSDQQPH